LQQGACKKGDHCKFRHLKEREIENEMEKFDTSVGQSTLKKDCSEGHYSPQRLIWDVEKKKWEWKYVSEEEMLLTDKHLSPTDGKMPKKRGWCWEGIHCTNPNCRFKHRNRPPIECLLTHAHQ